MQSGVSHLYWATGVDCWFNCSLFLMVLTSSCISEHTDTPSRWIKFRCNLINTRSVICSQVINSNLKLNAQVVNSVHFSLANIFNPKYFNNWKNRSSTYSKQCKNLHANYHSDPLLSQFKASTLLQSINATIQSMILLSLLFISSSLILPSKYSIIFPQYVPSPYTTRNYHSRAKWQSITC